MAPKCCSPLLCLCKKYHNFIRDILYEMIRSGATTVLGKVAEKFLYVQLCIRRYSHSVLVWQVCCQAGRGEKELIGSLQRKDLSLIKRG